MPVIRERASLSQFAELVGVPASRLIGLEMDRRGAGIVTLVLEDEMAQTVGTIPQLTTGGKTVGGKKPKGGKRGVMHELTECVKDGFFGKRGR